MTDLSSTFRAIANTPEISPMLWNRELIWNTNTDEKGPYAAEDDSANLFAGWNQKTVKSADNKYVAYLL